MSIKKFEQFINEGYNLNTLKSYIDKGNKLWVRVDPNVDYPGKESDHEDLEVKDIDVEDIHDGTIAVESPSGEQIFIQHDDIIKTITDTQKNVSEDLENHSSDDFYYKDEVTSLCWRLFSKIRKGDINDWYNLNNYVESELLQIKQKR